MLENDSEKLVHDVPWSKPSVIRSASSWLASNGIITDFHKNTLVVGVLMESKKILDTEFFIKEPAGQNRGIILVYVFVGRFFLWFGRKNKIGQAVIKKTVDMLPDYDVVIKFKLYKGKTDDNRGD